MECADRNRWSMLTSTHARRAEDPHIFATGFFQAAQQFPPAGDLAGQAVAYPEGQCRRCRILLVDDIEMRIESGHFVDLGLGQAEHLRQCGRL